MTPADSVARPARPRAWPRLAWLPIAVLALAWAASITPVGERLSRSVDDSVRVAAARPDAFEHLAVIDVDDASLAALRPLLGPWPWKRDVYAVLAGFLRDAGVRTMVFDIVFGEPRDGDAAFAQALGNRSDVVLGGAGLAENIEQESLPDADLDSIALPLPASDVATRWPAATLPAASLLAAMNVTGRASAVGIVSTPLDADGQLRRLPLLHRIGSKTLPSLALAALLADAGEARPAIGLDRQELRIGPHRWPIDAHGTASLLLPANASAVPTLAANTVLRAALGQDDAAAVKAALAGRTVFIGSSAFLGDLVITPQGAMTGTAVLANAYEALRRDDVLRDASLPMSALSLLLLAAALVPSALVVARGAPHLPRDAIAAAVAAMFVAVITWLSLTLMHTQAAPLLPMSVAATGFILSALVHWRRATLANHRLSDERIAADAANAAKTEFLTSVSHELRTPLHAVLGMADVLSRTSLSAEQQRYVGVFRQAGTDLTALIDDLLDLARIEAGRLALHPEPFDLATLLLERVRLLEPRATAKGLALELRMTDSTEEWVIGDAHRLAQIVVNLVGNAIKFTRRGGISIRVERLVDGLLHIEVIDTGIGISASQHDRIFGRFAQADASVAREHGGAGLGLAITRRMVEMMGGSVWLASEPGKGSAFHVAIDMPRTPPPAGTVSLELPIEPDQPVGQGIHILLAEDNEVNVLVMEAMLAHSPHSLRIARSGESAVDLYRTTDFGLVLMDVHMPGMDGYAATRAIRDHESGTGRRRTAVVALTANAFDADRRASLDAGCDAHLSKPLGRDRLLEAIALHGAPSRGKDVRLAETPPGS